MNRRGFLKRLGCGAAALAVGAGCSIAQRSRKRPNFVFFLIDDMGWADVSCYGSNFYETPNIDRLAREGMRFTDAYAACPVCSPTRASIMTGKYPARLGITQWIGASQKPVEYVDRMALEEVTIAEALKEAGYLTGFVGKWHLSSRTADRADYYPDKQGFDVNIAGDWSGAPPSYFHPYKRGTRTLETMPPGGEQGDYLTDRLTDEALEFLDTSKNRPFLLYLSHYAVHTPLQSKQQLTDKYKAKAEKMPKGDGPAVIAERDADAKQVQDNPVYAGMVQSVDESVGRVLARLKELGLERDTIVVFMSDNGGLSTKPKGRGVSTSNLPLRAGKGWLYEGGIREPMIVKWPGVVKSGSECSEPVTSTDFYPTMLEMAGLSLRPEQHADGVSLMPLLKGRASVGRKAIYWHYPHYHGSNSRPSAAVRAGDYKLIEWYETGQVELYNLQEDIGERNDLATRLPQKAAELRKMLHEWLDETGATVPTAESLEKFRKQTGRSKW
jgi:arylsulfatase A-like enzyme